MRGSLAALLIALYLTADAGLGSGAAGVPSSPQEGLGPASPPLRPLTRHAVGAGTCLRSAPGAVCRRRHAFVGPLGYRAEGAAREAARDRLPAYRVSSGLITPSLFF